ncbi:hypothetical protein DMC47_35270 [Nostoc sp. 3335mG]|nr:hypothetical protein DMC47_35270 [Nostoc sp. 3335mG]
MIFSFDPGTLALDDIERRTADIWADLRWDMDAQARLKRDGLALDLLNLGGACPYRFAPGEDGQLVLTLAQTEHSETLIDLWRLHFLRSVRPRRSGG